ncbi:MAG: hypothetical protein K9N48_06490 [Verrucomicrobia bacterium]|nr:hypothetical protein [Verrucomicrobiota bacterium]
MNLQLLTLLAALATTNGTPAVSNWVADNVDITVDITNPNSAVEREYRELLEMDDEIAAEIDELIRRNSAFSEKGAGMESPLLQTKIEGRLKKVEDAYEDFIRRHPEHVRARLAYGSFLMDMGKELKGKQQWEEALALDEENPAAWNNLANYFGHRGPVKKAFEYYAKAIELNPVQSVYYQNLATTVLLFRKDAKEYYDMDEQEVFDRALSLYRKALKLDPNNFVLANDLAQSYYIIKPRRIEEAIAAWKDALRVAGDPLQKQGVLLHLARWYFIDENVEKAREYLDGVTNNVYASVKERIADNLDELENGNQDDAAVTPEEGAHTVRAGGVD